MTDAEEDVREIARLLSGALPGGYEVRLRLTATSLPDGAEPEDDGEPWCGNAFKAEFEMYWRFGVASFGLIQPVADGGWRRTPEKAYEALLREFGSIRRVRVRYWNSGTSLTVCFPAAETPEELELRLAVEGCSIEGENAPSFPA